MRRLGLILLLTWIIDAFNIVFLHHKPHSLLWYSNAGLLATSIALLTRNSLLVFILFCALFVVEFLWGIGFLSLLFLHKIPGINVGFEFYYLPKDFILTMYHFLIPPVLLFGVFQLKRVYKHAWIGALVYSTTLILLTYFFVTPEKSVNCVHIINHCRIFAPFLFNIENPTRIYVGLTLITLFIYIPSNYFLYKIGKRLKWK